MPTYQPMTTSCSAGYERLGAILRSSTAATYAWRGHRQSLEFRQEEHHVRVTGGC